jgi:hypothetical protein
LIVRRWQIWANARDAEATMRQAAVEDVMARILAGRMTRRAFLARAAALGLSASAAGALLAACSRVPSRTPTSRPDSSADASPARVRENSSTQARGAARQHRGGAVRLLRAGPPGHTVGASA